MFLKRLHLPVGICYSRGEEGMRHSNRGKPKKNIHIFISIPVDPPPPIDMYHAVPCVTSLSSAPTFMTCYF